MLTMRRIARAVLVAVALCAAGPAAWPEPRPAQVAGSFYPSDAAALRQTVTELLAQRAAPEPSTPKPRILISPHAGYAYSGPVAAAAFREVQGRRYDAVVVVGFMHRQPFSGTSVEDRDAYATPLGAIPVDQDAVRFLLTQPSIAHHEPAHAAAEHSLEVMLPFLQVALGSFKLVPILMGDVDRHNAEALADALAALAGRGDYLFVFSSDLSHYHPYDQARERDETTVMATLLETGQAVDRLFQAGLLEACGRAPIVTSLLLARRLGYPSRRLLLYANSGDTTGERERVVGYAAIGMYEPAAASADGLAREAGMALVRAARSTLRAYFGSAVDAVGLEQWPELQHARGMFVTLRRADGQLRGCIGRIDSDVPMAQLVGPVALEAALEDHRFAPVTAAELDRLTIEVSVLSKPRPIESAQEIIAGRDGVVLRKDGQSGVFLPQVWDETGWTRVEFLRELASQKAGLDPDAWQHAQLLTFQDHAFEEPVASDAAAP